MSYSGNLLLRGLINVVSKPQTLPVRGMIFAANHHFNHNRMSEFLAQNFLHSESMAEREIKSERQKLAADIAEKDKDIEKLERELREKRDARNKLIYERQNSSKDCKQPATKVILPNGKYIIRCFVADPDKLWYICTAALIHLNLGFPPEAMAGGIRRKAMDGEKIRERHLPDECFVELINRPADGIVLLRHIQTGRYAAVDRECSLFREATGREVSEEDHEISFYVKHHQNGRIGKDAEFELFAPTGNKADGLAIRSVGKDRYLTIRISTLCPNCEDISQATLFKFEPSVDEDRILDGEEDISTTNMK